MMSPAKKATKGENSLSKNSNASTSSDAKSVTKKQLKSPSTTPRRSKRQRTPPKQSGEIVTVTAGRKKRQRKVSQKMKEVQQTEQEKIEEMLRPKRKYRKRQKKSDSNLDNSDDVSNAKICKNSDDASHSDESSSLDENEMICCMCLCSVDYSDRDQFNWPVEEDSDSDSDSDIDEDDNGNMNSSDDASMKDDDKESLKNGESMTSTNQSGSSEESEDFYGVKLPPDLHDPNNALLICDGCDRCYHQRCHFVPVLSVPRKDWYCLICQYKAKILTMKKGRRGRPKLSSSPKKQLEGTKVGNDSKSNDLCLVDTSPPSVEELDIIYRVAQVEKKNDTTRSNGSAPQKFENKNTTNGAIQSRQSEIQMRFEYHSSQMKADLLRKGSQQLVKTIDHNLSSIRLCQNSIRALIETNNRARKALIEKYNRTHQLPQELVQNVMRLSKCKLKLRNLFFTLQHVIRNKTDREELWEWFVKAKEEGKFTPAKLCPPHGGNGKSINKSALGENTKTNSSSVPLVISVDHSSTGKSEHASNGEDITDPLIDFEVLEQKLFVQGTIRSEPRFDIKDYDADEDDEDDESDNAPDKIKCCMCYSGHVEEEDENDVVMCDGQHCFRAFHMKCCMPNVTQKMLDDSPDGTWFCPYCVCFAKTIHYTESEYLGYEEKEVHVDNESTKSWDHAGDIFPEALSALKAAEKWKIGKRNENSDHVLANLLGIEIAKDVDGANEEGFATNNDDINDDESDKTFDSVPSKAASDGEEDDSSDDESYGVDWGIDKSELSALSCSESDSDDDDSETEGKSQDSNVRKSKRLRRGSNPIYGEDTGTKPTNDIGKLDTANIVRGKRNRTKVDYNRYVKHIALQSINDAK